MRVQLLFELRRQGFARLFAAIAVAASLFGASGLVATGLGAPRVEVLLCLGLAVFSGVAWALSRAPWLDPCPERLLESLSDDGGLCVNLELALALQRYGARSVVQQFVAPLLELCELWRSRRALTLVHQELLESELVRFLGTLSPGFKNGDLPTLVCVGLEQDHKVLTAQLVTLECARLGVHALLLGARVPVLDCLSLARERQARGLLLLTGRGVDPEVEQERLEWLAEACAGSSLELGLFELSSRLVPHRVLAVERCLELRTLADWVSGSRATPSRSSSELVVVGAC